MSSLAIDPENPKKARRNPTLPLWVLTPKEEKEVFERWKTMAYGKCDDVVKAFADCATTRFLDIATVCKPFNEAMKSCIHGYQKIEILDEIKDQYIQEKFDRVEAEIKKYNEEQKALQQK